MKKIAIFIGIGIILVTAIIYLSGFLKDLKLDDRCKLKPDSGPCSAELSRYYFDQDDRRCKEFYWGGCSGIVPFMSLESCEEICD